MATTTHTISIRENLTIRNGTVSAKRVSKSRMYGACVVATATQKLVDDRATQLAADSAALEVAKAQREAAMARYSMTVAEATAKHSAETKVWYEHFFAAQQRIRGSRGYVPGLDKVVEAELATQGILSPYLAGTYYDILSADFEVRKLAGSVERLSRPVAAGDQAVLTWSRDAGLAGKALGQWAEHYTKDGHYTLAVRTDITVTTK